MYATDVVGRPLEEFLHPTQERVELVAVEDFPYVYTYVLCDMHDDS